MLSCRVIASRNRFDLGKSFFVNYAALYQLYPTILLMPWTDPNRPGGGAADMRQGLVQYNPAANWLAMQSVQAPILLSQCTWFVSHQFCT